MFRFLALFVLGFAPLAVCDGFLVQAEYSGGRALATLILGLTALVLGTLAFLLRPLFARLLPRTVRASDSLPLALGLALALIPQARLLIPIEGVGGRIAYHPVWAPVTTLLGLLGAIPLFGVLLRRVSMPRRKMWALAIGVWLAMAGGFGWLDAQQASAVNESRVSPLGRAQAPREPDVTLIVLDTLRADGVTGTWQGQQLMPLLQSRLAAARRFPRSYSGSNSTPPGHATLFVGAYPAETDTLAKGFVELAGQHLTVAEYLREFGYRTLGVTSNRRLDSSTGFAQGFEIWDDSLVVDASGRSAVMRRLSLCSLVRAIGGKAGTIRLKALADRWSSANQLEVTAQDTAATAARALERLARQPDEPVFCFVNFIDPHMPYETRAELAAAFLPNVDEPVLERARRFMPAILALLREMQLQLQAGVPPARRGEMDRRLLWLNEAYWEQCRQLDEGLEALLRELDQHGLADPEDLIVITSDHGEQLGEHAEFMHGGSLFEDSVRVPLLVLGGGFAPGEDPQPTSGTDFYPTVLAAMAVDPSVWPAALVGKPLQTPAEPDRIVRFEGGRLRGFAQGLRKMIALDDGSRLVWQHAFDLDADPFEERNLFGAAAPEWVLAFVANPPILSSQNAVLILGGPSDTDLAALGYVDEVADGQ
jgi:arylsulfatase A-like enzyme